MEPGSQSIAGLRAGEGSDPVVAWDVRPCHRTELRIDGTRHTGWTQGPACRMSSGHRMSEDFCRLDTQAEPWPDLHLPTG